jgi:hypothetical protein
MFAIKKKQLRRTQHRLRKRQKQKKEGAKGENRIMGKVQKHGEREIPADDEPSRNEEERALHYIIASMQQRCFGRPQARSLSLSLTEYSLLATAKRKKMN